jgi:hypothetical protein
MMRQRLTNSRIARLEQTLRPQRTGPPACPRCGAPDTEGPGYLMPTNDEPPTCDVCGRTLDQQGRPLNPVYIFEVVGETDIRS